MTMNDRDALLRLALTPSADVVAPADLGDAIYREVLATPQRRGVLGLRRLGRLGWIPAPSPQLVALALLALLAVALIVAGLLRPPQPPVLTTYHGGPDRTGVMPGPGPAGVPIRLWQDARPGAVSAMPLPVGDRVYVADTGGFLAAIGSASGTRTEVDVGSAIYTGPALAGSLIVVGTEAGDVVAFTESLEQAWRTPLAAGAVVVPLLVADGVIYAGTDGGQLVALSAADGRILRRYPLDAAVSRGPAFADGVGYVPLANGWMSAIEVGTGNVRWSVELASGRVGTPALAGGRVYVGRGIEGEGLDHDLVALDARDGRMAWRFGSRSGLQVHNGAIAHGRVYAASEDGNLYALDPSDGREIWRAEVGGRLGTLASVAGDVIYVSSTNGSVHAIDAGTGDPMWSVEVDDGEPTMAAVVGGRVYVGTSLGQVIAFADPPRS